MQRRGDWEVQHSHFHPLKELKEKHNHINYEYCQHKVRLDKDSENKI